MFLNWMMATMNDDYIAKVIGLNLGEIIDRDHEQFLDMIAERAGYPLLMDVSYEIINTIGGTIRLLVRGDPSLEQACQHD